MSYFIFAVSLACGVLIGLAVAVVVVANSIGRAFDAINRGF